MKPTTILVWVGIGVAVFVLTSTSSQIAATPIGELLPIGGGSSTGPAGAPPVSVNPPPQPGAGQSSPTMTPVVQVGQTAIPNPQLDPNNPANWSGSASAIANCLGRSQDFALGQTVSPDCLGFVGLT